MTIPNTPIDDVWDPITHSLKTTISGEVDVDTTGLASETTLDAVKTAAQTIVTQTDAVESSLTSIDGHVDGLETLVTTTNTSLSTIDSHVDGLETLVGTSNTNLGTLVTQTDGLEAAVGAPADAMASSDTGTFSQISLFKRLLDKITTFLGILPAARGQTTASGSLSVVQASDSVYLSTSVTTTTVQAIGTTDAISYSFVSVHITSQGGSSTVNFQASNDNTNWVSIALLNNSSTGVSTTASTTTGIWDGPLVGRYFRLSVTGIVSGTTTAALVFSNTPRFAVAAEANVTRISGSSPTIRNYNSDDITLTAVSAQDVGAYLYGYDGTNADRIRTDATGKPQVSLYGKSSVAGDTSFLLNSDGSPQTDLRKYAGNVMQGPGDGRAVNTILNTAIGVATSGGSFDMWRTPATFKTANANANGDNAVWTPTSGKKFRLMRYFIQITGDSITAGGGVITLTFRDATTDLLITHSFYLPAVAGTTMLQYTTGWIDLGNGKLSAVANNVLNLNLSAAITGTVRVTVAGTEE